jgi:hypothetical protein
VALVSHCIVHDHRLLVVKHPASNALVATHTPAEQLFPPPAFDDPEFEFAGKLVEEEQGPSLGFCHLERSVQYTAQQPVKIQLGNKLLANTL